MNTTTCSAESQQLSTNQSSWRDHQIVLKTDSSNKFSQQQISSQLNFPSVTRLPLCRNKSLFPPHTATLQILGLLLLVNLLQSSMPEVCKCSIHLPSTMVEKSINLIKSKLKRPLVSLWPNQSLLSPMAPKRAIKQQRISKQVRIKYNSRCIRTIATTKSLSSRTSSLASHTLTGQPTEYKFIDS